MTKIHLVLVDDWEVRGDGSGDMRAIQFEPLKKLLAVYEKHGLKASLSAELMQQLAHREWGEKHPELKALADEWDEIVRDVIRRGHDVQLHLHPQWLGAQYADGKWTLPGDWSLTRHRAEDVRDMLRRGRDYLVSLIKPIRPDYEVVSFKAGAWALAPSDFLLDLIAEAGIRVDLSVFPGAFYENAKVKLDYRACEETIRPYYPDSKDARRVALEPGPVVCFPGNFVFTESVGHAFWHRVRLLRKRCLAWIGVGSELPRRANEGDGSDSYAYEVWGVDESEPPPHVRPPLPPRSPGLLGLALWLVRPPLNWIHNAWIDVRDELAQLRRPKQHRHHADLSLMTSPLMRDLLDAIRERARASGLETVPIVLENHTKDVRYLEPFETFARCVRRARDIEVVTLTDLKKNLDAGVYRPALRSRESVVVS